MGLKQILHFLRRLALTEPWKKMLYGNVFISHGLRFVFCIDQDFVQVIADIQPSSSAFTLSVFHGLLCFVFKHIALDAHFVIKVS